MTKTQRVRTEGNLTHAAPDINLIVGEVDNFHSSGAPFGVPCMELFGDTIFRRLPFHVAFGF